MLLSRHSRIELVKNMKSSKFALFSSVVLVSTIVSVNAQTFGALLNIGTYKAMALISKKDAMTPDHIPSGAAVVVACYKIDNSGKEPPDSLTISTLYDSATAPYYHVYQKANTIVYDTAIHQKYSPTYGQDRALILKHAKDLTVAFKEDKAVVFQKLLDLQKTRDANNKPTTIAVSTQAVEKSFAGLNDLNKAAGIYDPATLKTFCKK